MLKAVKPALLLVRQQLHEVKELSPNKKSAGIASINHSASGNGGTFFQVRKSIKIGAAKDARSVKPNCIVIQCF